MTDIQPDSDICPDPDATDHYPYGTDPRVSTSFEWVRVARSQYEHYRKIADAWDPTREVALRHHERVTADLVPHLVAQIEHQWTQVETWVKWWRDEYRADYGDDYVARQAIDNMLDDLRDHLVTGEPLHRPVNPNTLEEPEEDRWTP